MSEVVEHAIQAVRNHQYSFWKFVSPNDAGITGAHQAGLYIPKNSINLLFDEPGIVGDNKEKHATIEWPDGTIAECRFIYYGKGTRNEYRITRLGKTFNVYDIVIIVKKNEDKYLGFILQTENDKQAFLGEFNLTENNTNSLIDTSNFDNFNTARTKISPPALPSHVETHEISFKPKAHVLILLGEELIKSPVMAIYELIKNGYDADAKNIDVIFHAIQDVNSSFIEIKDTGTGITAEVLQNVWFEPGTDFRKPINETGQRTINRSPIFKRIPMGEKGVGRFAVHKLGDKIRLISRPAKVISNEEGDFVRTELLNYELTVNIDWRAFLQSKYLEDVVIEWHKNYDQSTFFFKNSHGTFIRVGNLKEEWTRGMARLLKKQTLSMLSPKNDPSKFSINLDFGNWWLNDIPDTATLLELAPYKLVAFVDKDFNMTFEYKFKLANNEEIGERVISDKSIEELDKSKYETNIRGDIASYFKDSLEHTEQDDPIINNTISEFEFAQTKFGSLMIELYSYDLDSNSLRDIINTPQLIKDLLKDHSGVKVFKDDLRVYDYGDPGNDWLGLDIRRVNNKEWFSNNQVIGYVYLDAEISGSLIEKTNREGFVKNAAFDEFIAVIDVILRDFKSERQSDRQRWLSFNHKAPAQQDSFKKRISGFKELIQDSNLDDNSKTTLLTEAVRVEEKYDEERDTLLIPAGVGMTASFAMHEIEKLVPRMEESVNESPINEHKLQSQVQELKDYSEGLLSVLKKGTNTTHPVLQPVEQAVSNYSSRLRSRNIKVDIHEEESGLNVLCDKRLLITVLMNILDNSIYWLDTTFKELKGIYIDIRRIERGISVLLVDNGPGFRERIEDIIRPYYSRKKNGIGIGMYLVDTVMIQYGKLNIIFDKEYLKERKIPEIYSGAAVELVFNKNQ